MDIEAGMGGQGRVPARSIRARGVRGRLAATAAVFVLLLTSCSVDVWEEDAIEVAAPELTAAVFVDALQSIQDAGSGEYTYERRFGISVGAAQGWMADSMVGRFTDGATRGAGRRSYTSSPPDLVGYAALPEAGVDYVVEDDAIYLRVNEPQLQRWERFDATLLDGPDWPDYSDGMDGAVPLLTALANIDPESRVSSLGVQVVNGEVAGGYRVLVAGSVFSAELGTLVLWDLAKAGYELEGKVAVDIWVSNGALVAARADLSSVMAEAVEHTDVPDLGAVGGAAVVSLEVKLAISGLGDDVTIVTPEITGAEGAFRTLVNIEVGDCPASDDLLADGAQVFIELTDCAGPKRYEVFARLPHADFSEVLLDEEALDGEVYDACVEVLREERDIAIYNSTLEIIYYTPWGGTDAVCLLESPDAVAGDLTESPSFESAAETVAIRPVDIEAGATDGDQRVSHLTRSVGGVVLLASGTDTSEDPQADVEPDPGEDPAPSVDHDDLAFWVSTNGGSSFEKVRDVMFSGVAGSQYPAGALATSEGFVIAVSEWGDSPTGIQVYRWAGGEAAWEQTTLESTSAGTDDWVEQLAQTAEGSLLLITSHYFEEEDFNGEIRVHRSTDGGRSWGASEVLGEWYDAYVEDLSVEENTITLRIYDDETGDSVLFTSTDDGSSWVQGETPEPTERWGVEVSNDSVQLYSEYGDVIERSTDGGETWSEVALPSHDGGDVRSSRVILDGEQVLVVGSMTARRGTAPAMWVSQDAGVSFALVWLDLDAPGASTRFSDAVPVDGGFAVAGSVVTGEWPNSDSDAAFWLVEVSAD